MTWSTFADDAVTAVQKAVALQRRTGLKNEHAMEAVADLFSLSPRRVRMWLYDEVINPKLIECRLIVHSWWAARDLEVTRLRTLADQIEQENERERVALFQFELPLGMVNDQKSTRLDRGTSNALARVASHLDRAAQAEAEYRRQRAGPMK